MIIRSQDKKRIVNFDNVEKIGVYGRFENPEDDEVNIWTVETPTACLGRYSNEEKGIKVLDMIQDEYQYTEECKYIGTGYKKPEFTFQMPQDDEVEV